MNILTNLKHFKANRQKGLAILIDPEKVDDETQLLDTIRLAEKGNIDFIFVGGSIITEEQLANTMDILGTNRSIPIVLFPGNALHISEKANALLFLSLISGRNPEYLIGQQVNAARKLKNTTLEVVPTGYILIDSGKLTTVQYVSNTKPIPNNHNELAVSTALAGQLLGMKLIYMDGGSGAKKPIKSSMIQRIAKAIDLPLIIGGGIRTKDTALKAWEAGADLVVVGNAIEHDNQFISELADCKSKINGVIQRNE